jgi:predicted SAM-dependent methyltransferase
MGLFLNIGSGQRPFDKPWLNLDTQAKYNPDVVCDCSRLPYDAEVADYVVLHHVLEHFGCGEGQGLLKECYRVLAPAGRLIVCVPDMRALAQAWLMGKMETQLFMTNAYGAFLGDDADRHRWAFDKESLKKELAGVAPWQSVKPFDWRHVPGALIAQDWWILGMEAIK